MTDLTFPDRPIGDVSSYGVSPIKHFGVTLVARADCATLVQNLVSERVKFHGFEAFTLFPDNKIQPHLSWSCDWPADQPATFDDVMKAIDRAPPEVTHFEFYFRVRHPEGRAV